MIIDYNTDKIFNTKENKYQSYNIRNKKSKIRIHYKHQYFTFIYNHYID